MAEALLIVFVDALPFRLADRLQVLRSGSHSGALIPGVGYSVNAQTELLAGLSPDEVGFFCEWGYAANGGLAPAKCLHLLRPMELAYPLQRVAHRVVNRLWRHDTKNIPFRFLPDLVPVGKNVLTDPSIESSIFVRFPALQTVTYLECANSDGAVHQLARRRIEEGVRQLLVTFTELDHIGHWAGIDSDPYRTGLSNLDERIDSLASAFVRRHPAGRVIIVSDHGMVDVSRHVDLEVERVLGAPGRATYHYFLEHTILRIWAFREDIRRRAAEAWGNVGFCSLLDSLDRQALGLTSPEFGDVIAMAADSTVFVPSFWGSKPGAGMHGYHPYLESQRGVVAVLNSRRDSLPQTMSAKLVYELLCEYLA